jgi:nucleotide-binding universal stress UspA family protein
MTEIKSDRPRVVVGVDGSEQSKQALRWAARFAASAGARVEAIAAWEYPTAYGWGAIPIEGNLEQDMAKALTATVDEVFGSRRPVDMELLVEQGHPARVLVEASKGALLLVVGSRGHGGFYGLLLGSVSANVAEHAKCPVLIIHDSEPVLAVA